MVAKTGGQKASKPGCVRMEWSRVGSAAPRKWISGLVILLTVFAQLCLLRRLGSPSRLLFGVHVLQLEPLLKGLAVVEKVLVRGEEAKRIAEGKIGDDIHCEELGFSAEVECLAFGYVPLDQVNEGEDIIVNSLLKILNFFAGIL